MDVKVTVRLKVSSIHACTARRHTTAATATARPASLRLACNHNARSSGLHCVLVAVCVCIIAAAVSMQDVLLLRLPIAVTMQLGRQGSLNQRIQACPECGIFSAHQCEGVARAGCRGWSSTGSSSPCTAAGLSGPCSHTEGAGSTCNICCAGGACSSPPGGNANPKR